jgi:hypothetical protein
MAGESNFKWTSTLPALALVVMVMLACSLVYNWWQNRRLRSAAPEIHAAQQQKASPVASAVPAPPQQPTETAPVPAPAAQPPVESPAPAAPGPSASVASRDEAPPPQAAGVPQPQPVPNATVHLEIAAQEPTWISVRTDGKYLFSGTLQPGDTRRIEAGENAVIRFGNAGGVAVNYNGKAIGPVGPKGQPRTVQFTSGGFQTAPSAPAAPKAPAFDPL